MLKTIYAAWLQANHYLNEHWIADKLITTSVGVFGTVITLENYGLLISCVAGTLTCVFLLLRIHSINEDIKYKRKQRTLDELDRDLNRNNRNTYAD